MGQEIRQTTTDRAWHELKIGIIERAPANMVVDPGDSQPYKGGGNKMSGERVVAAKGGLQEPRRLDPMTVSIGSGRRVESACDG